MVLGQCLGLGALFAASLAAAVLAWTVPAEIISWLGAVPIFFGLGMLLHGAPEAPAAPPASGVLAVASVTLANGSDNLAVYIPLLASVGPGEAAVIAAVFAAMTGVWCVAAWWLVHHPGAGAPLRRYGPRAVPYVLIGIGLWILFR